MSPDYFLFARMVSARAARGAAGLLKAGCRMARRLFSERELPTTLANMVLILALTTLLTGFEAALWLALIATPIVIALLGGASVLFGREVDH